MADKRYIIDINDAERQHFDTIIDVRSPSEYEQDHIPGAINCPVLNDKEREEIGTLYVQVSPFIAKKKGAALISRNIARHLEEHFSDKEKNWKPLVYCWRGGQRSRSMQTIFREIGWHTHLVKGGYKAYRSHVLEHLKTRPLNFRYVVIGGPTGSGKTMMLNVLKQQGAQVLDLEDLARHKGSVLGTTTNTAAQSQKAFDTKLNELLASFNPDKPVFTESESRKIGIIHLPDALFKGMKAGELVLLDIPLSERIKYLSKEYQWFQDNPDDLKDKLLVLKELKGKKTIEEWFSMIDKKEWPLLIENLLKTHYDPLYSRSSHREYTDQTARHAFPVSDISEESFGALAKELIQRFK